MGRGRRGSRVRSRDPPSASVAFRSPFPICHAAPDSVYLADRQGVIEASVAHRALATYPLGPHDKITLTLFGVENLDADLQAFGVLHPFVVADDRLRSAHSCTPFLMCSRSSSVSPPHKPCRSGWASP